MKKVLLVLLSMTVFWSCKKNDIQNDQKESLEQNSPSSKNKAKVKWAADGKWDLLGFGYDVTGDVLNANSCSDAPIIDMARFERDYGQRLGYSNTGSGTQDFYIGVSALDYLKDVIKKRSWGIKASWDASQSTTDPSKPYYFSGSVSRNKSDQNTTTFSSRFSYASFESFRIVKRLWFTQDASPSVLVNYLTPEFINNSATLDAESLVRRYGTHVLLDITIGGKLRLDYSSEIVKEGDYTRKERATKAGLTAGVRKILGMEVDVNVSSDEITKVNTESRSKQYTLSYFGGTNSGRTLSFDIDGNTSESLNISSWEQSVTPTNSTLVHVDNAIPIYEFIIDPIKKSQVKAAVEQYIIDNQVKLSADPIYQFYSSATGGNHFTSRDINATQGYSGWRYDGPDFKAFIAPAPGTIPVHQFYNGRNFDHFISTNRNVTYGLPNWDYYGIEFYAYPNQVPGTIPIYEYYNSRGSDHFVTSNPNITQFSGWTSYGVVFYAFPN